MPSFNEWACVTKLWSVCLCRWPLSRPWRMRVIISKQLLFLSTYFDCSPGKFVAFVSHDDDQRQQASEFYRGSFEALEDLEEHARELHNRHLRPLAA